MNGLTESGDAVNPDSMFKFIKKKVRTKMQTLNDIWVRRLKKLKDETNQQKTNPKTGFDFSNGIKPKLLYENEKHYDSTINDFHEFLNDVRDEHAYSKTTWTRKSDKNKLIISIKPYVIEEQSYFIIEMPECGLYSLSFYKRHTNIDSIVDLEYGTPINLEDLTEILYCCGLEEAFCVDDE